MKKVLSLLLVLIMLLSLCACGAPKDSVTEHNYQDGICTDCGAAEPNVTVTGEWFLEGINNEGTEYETMRLTLGEGTASITIAYFGKLWYDSQEMLDAILKDGYYETEDGGMYYYDILQYNGIYYCSAMYGNQAEGTYTVKGSTITVDLTTYHGMTGKLVLKKTAESTLSLISVDEALFDETIREVFNNGRIFTLVK